MRLKNRLPRVYRRIAPVYHQFERLAGLVVQAFDSMLLNRMLRRSGQVGRPGEEGVRVVFDACAFMEPQTGIARLWERVMEEWSASGFSTSVTVLDRYPSVPRFPGFTYQPMPPVRVRDSRRQRVMLERVCRSWGADVFVSSLYTHPLACPTLLYLYDMTPEVLRWDLQRPEWQEKASAIRYASALACLSESTAGDLRRLYPQTSSVRSRTILPGVGPEFFPATAEQVTQLRHAFALPERYFVFIGHREGYKNADLLFEALREIVVAEEFGLLLVGGASHLEPRFSARADNIPVRIARLSDEELRSAYSGAEALLYLSKYEGFGLPIIEAMACGCPVIACRNSSLAEAGGDASVYVDESDASMLAAAMTRVMQPGVRAELVEKGMRWSSRFDWGATAAALQEELIAVARR